MKKSLIWNLLLILGIIPFVLPFILGIYRMTIESWAMIDWLVMYSFIYWPTYIAGAVVIAASIIGKIAKNEGAKTSPRGGFTPSKQSAGRRPFEAQGAFRAALSVFRRKMEAGADKTESTFAVGKYVCGARLKALP